MGLVHDELKNDTTNQRYIYIYIYIIFFEKKQPLYWLYMVQKNNDV